MTAFRFLLLFLISIPLRAEIIIAFNETNNDVVASFSGTLDTNDPNIFDYSALGSGPKFNPSLGYFNSLPSGWRTPGGTYLIDGPTSGPFYDGPRLGSSGVGFGSGGSTIPNVVIGDAFGIFQTSLVLPNDWTSGSEISGQMTWEDTTLDELGVDSSEDHEWTLRGTADKIIMTFVPETSAFGLITGVFLMLFVSCNRFVKTQ